MLVHGETSNIKNILTIQKFKLEEEDISQIFPRAYALPKFLLTNLLSNQRIVKHFCGQYSILEAFAFQLMKLALQVQVEGKDYRAQLFRIFVFDEYFQEGELEDEYFSDFQYRKFVKDFIEIVESENTPNFQKTAEKYPIITQILLKLLIKLTPYSLWIEKERQKSWDLSSASPIYKYLCEIFKIQSEQVCGCFKFCESDVFIYFENGEVYLIFEQNNQQILEPELQKTNSSFVCGVQNSFVTKYKSPPQITKSNLFDLICDQKNTGTETGLHILNSQQKQNYCTQLLSKKVKANQFPFKTAQNTKFQLEISQRQNWNQSLQYNKQQKARPQVESDFTKTHILELMTQPCKNKVLQIKQRSREAKKDKYFWLK